MSNKTYDTLKITAQIILPGIGTCFVIASIWGVPYAEQIVATITALDTLLGTMLGVSSMRYKKGLEDEQG